MSAGRTERGSASLLGVAMLGVLLLVGAALGVVAAMFVAHRSAQAAADLAALAGATALADAGDACAESGRIAAANGATLTGCEVDGREVRVLVEAPGPRWWGRAVGFPGEARAGPAYS